jgi:cytochrome c biogenesis protein CcdA
LLKAIHLTGETHLITKIAGIMVLFLEVITPHEYFYPGKSILHISRSQRNRIRYWLTKATLPSSFIAGVIVGLCTFPCTGGIYIAILGLLVLKTTYFLGFLYLIVYNKIFVMPLFILAEVHNARAVERIERWKEMSWRRIKLVAGWIMIALGLVILALTTYSDTLIIH